MELRVLEYFLAVAREQSISGAAEYLHLTQPTLSRQLRELEEELGCTLLVRGKRGQRTALTPEGRLFRQRAQEILDLASKAEQEVRQSGKGITGDVMIGAGETDSMRVIARLTERIRRENPGIRIHVVSGDTQDLTDRLERGLFDFALLFGATDPKKFVRLPLHLRDRWGVLMRKDSPLSQRETICPADLWDKPLILSRQIGIQDGFLRWIQRPLEELQVAATYNLAFNASLMAEEGLGYVLVLDKLIRTDGDSPLCFRPLEPALEAEFALVWTRYAVFSRASEYFLRQLREELGLPPDWFEA